MSIIKYGKDHILPIFAGILFGVIEVILLVVFSCKFELIITISVLFLLFGSFVFFRGYVRRRGFYNELLGNIEKLDKKYLVLETLPQPDFYDGEILFQALYDINKSMCETVREYKGSVKDFKEYVEMWVHEVKIPIASLLLMCHNNRQALDKKYVEQIRRMDNYTDQVLYYVRSENTENDYLIREVELSKIIKKVAMKNQLDLLENHIDFQVENVNVKVLTDGKWMEFILSQVLNNSIKYKSQKRHPVIGIYTEEFPEKTLLHIKDNGIGIVAKDLPNVFKKSFTGENGRLHGKSTGMGLFIVERLCKSLGHGIHIESQAGEYTEVTITFGKNDFFV